MIKPKLLFFFLIGFTIVLCSCEYEFIEVEQPDPGQTVSFSKDILSILEKRSCATCHGAGSSTDLSPDKAYQTIVSGLINTEQQESSKIYSYPSPGSSQHQYKKYTASEAGLILSWINQGAKDN